MTTPTARVDRTPTHNDLEIPRLAHRALADVKDGGRCSERKVFIASLWTQMLAIEAQTGGTLTDGAAIHRVVFPDQRPGCVPVHVGVLAADRDTLGGRAIAARPRRWSR